MLGGQFGQGVQLCLLWDVGEPAGLGITCRNSSSHGFDLRALSTAGCEPPWMQCLSFTLKASINHIVRSRWEGREAPGLLRGGGGVTQLQHFPFGPGHSKFSKPDVQTHVRHVFSHTLWPPCLSLKAGCSCATELIASPLSLLLLQ